MSDVLCTNVYDLTGRERFFRYASISDSNASLEIDENGEKSTILLDTLLVYPREKDSNRVPYLQDYIHPNLSDFETPIGYDYHNSFFLKDMLNGLVEQNDENRYHLKQYFTYQRKLLDNKYLCCKNKEYKNVLLVPDYYDSLTQEKILQSCTMKRDETYLLWRSVASCLGAEDYLKERGAKDGDSVVVIDIQQTEITLSILKLKQEEGFLIPKRRAYKKNSPLYPLQYKHNKYSYASTDKDIINFYLHTCGTRTRDVELVLPRGDGCWTKNNFRINYDEINIPTFDKSEFVKAAWFIIVGEVDETHQASLQHQLSSSLKVLNADNVISESQINKGRPLLERIYFPALGAARFATRNKNGLPTYRDECEKLSLVVFDPLNEDVVPKTLVEEDDDVKGGKIIEGEIIDGVSIEQGSSSGEFYLCLGEALPRSPLKYLTQQFTEDIASSTQPLLMKPKMVPGQGLATVYVVCNPQDDEAPLFDDIICLDWLNMENSNSTMASLDKETKRSFPPDCPDVEADNELWWEVKDKVVNFVDDRIRVTKELGELFSKATWANPLALTVKEQLRRKNVFGTSDKKSVPSDANPELLDALFKKLKDEFERYKSKDWSDEFQWRLRLIAWTYQRKNPLFDEVKKFVLDFIKRDAYSLRGLKPQYFTFCANFLWQDENLQQYFSLFNSRMNKSLDTPWHWCRALGDLLMFNNEMLKNISTDDCRVCMNLLCNLYAGNRQSTVILKCILKSILFLLRRRRYDRIFCKMESPIELDKELYKKITFISEEKGIAYIQLRKAVGEYLNGHGSILPVADL